MSTELLRKKLADLHQTNLSSTTEEERKVNELTVKYLKSVITYYNTQTSRQRSR